MLGNPISHAVWTVKQCHPLRALSTQLALVFFISSFLSFLLGVEFIRQTSTLPGSAGQLSYSPLAIHHPMLSLLPSPRQRASVLAHIPWDIPLLLLLHHRTSSQPTSHAKGAFHTRLPTAAQFNPVNSLCHSRSANNPRFWFAHASSKNSLVIR